MYYPYPDPMVDFAFPVDRSLKAEDFFRTTYDDHMRRLQEVLNPEDYRHFVENSNLNLIIYPVDPIDEKTFEWFAQARTRKMKELPPLLARIHPGSPHMYWRHLWMGGDSPYELVDYPLEYRSIDTKKVTFLPLDTLGTQLVVTQRETKKPTTESPEKKGTTYCGDVKTLWAKDYEAGLAGNFQKCRDLYLQQTKLGRRLFGASHDRFKPQEMPTEIAVAARHEPDDPFISIGETLREKLAQLREEDESLKKQSAEIKMLPAIRSDGSKEASLEMEASEWRLNYLTQQLEAAKKNYFEKEQELYRIQKVPFIRDK